MHPNQLIPSHSNDGWLHQPVCQECHAYSVCLFSSRSTVCSSLKEEDITLLCGSWCRYLKFSAVSSITGYFPHQPHPHPMNSPTTGHLLMRHTSPVLSFIYRRVTLKTDKGRYRQISHHLQKHSSHWCLASNLKFWPACSTSAVHLFWKPEMAQARSTEVMMGGEQLRTIDCFYYCVSKYMGAKPVWFDWNSGQRCWNISS